MKSNTYTVTLETPVGIKKGTMTFEKEGSSISGVLSIMKERNPFSGTICGASCHIIGSLKTLVNTIPYEADGTITDEMLSFVILTDKHRLMLCGGAVNAKII